MIIVICLNSFGKQISIVDCPEPLIVGNPNESNYQVIYPLGWSESGDFSYIHQDINALQGGGGFEYHLIVQNMKTDKILYRKSIYYDPEDGYIWKPLSTAIDSLAHKRMAYFDYAFFKTIAWSENKNKILEVLNKYKIGLTKLPLNNVLKLKEKGIKIEEKSNSANLNQYMTIDYKISLYSNNIQKKVIYHWYCQEAICSEKSSYKQFMIKGYFESPFENRIAIIVFMQDSGYEEKDEFPFAVGAYLKSDGTN